MEPSNTVLVVGGVCLLAGLLILVIALRQKGDVRAIFRAPFLSFSLEAKDKRRKSQ
jgi:hypothetical protein